MSQTTAHKFGWHFFPSSCVNIVFVRDIKIYCKVYGNRVLFACMGDTKIVRNFNPEKMFEKLSWIFSLI